MSFCRAEESEESEEEAEDEGQEDGDEIRPKKRKYVRRNAAEPFHGPLDEEAARKLYCKGDFPAALTFLRKLAVIPLAGRFRPDHLSYASQRAMLLLYREKVCSWGPTSAEIQVANRDSPECFMTVVALEAMFVSSRNLTKVK